MKRHRKLLHGTSSIYVLKILREGLGWYDRRRGVGVFAYLTDDPVIADYYAKEAVVGIDLQDGRGPDVPVILEVIVSESSLRADFVSYDEPLTFFRDKWAKNERNWHRKMLADKIPFPKSERDWRTSLRIVHSVRHEGLISPKCIKVAKWYVPDVS